MIKLSDTEINSAIKQHRTALMGVAMLMVIVYHSFCWVYNPLGRANIGFAGVDIFMFLSGLGLCFSFQKNTPSGFYKKRFVRVYPLYIIGVLFVYFAFKSGWDIKRLISNITTIGFYLEGGVYRFDWYLMSIIDLYILFPLIYLVSTSSKLYAFLATLALSTAVLLLFDLPWWYDCLIGRLPIFVYGVVTALGFSKHKIVGIIGFLVFPLVYLIVSQFLATSCLTIAIIALLICVLPKCPPGLYRIVEFFGKYSLEIYMANLMIFWAFETWSFTVVEKSILFLAIQAFFSFIFIYINKLLGRLLRNWLNLV